MDSGTISFCSYLESKCLQMSFPSNGEFALVDLNMRLNQDGSDAAQNYLNLARLTNQATSSIAFSSPSLKGRVVPQPGDGNCLFHSLLNGMDPKTPALTSQVLRLRLADFIENNSQEVVASNTIANWVLWESNLTPAQYSQELRHGKWGGGIEIAVFCKLFTVWVHVLRRERGGGFTEIATFQCDDAKTRDVYILYSACVHYDAVEIEE